MRLRDIHLSHTPSRKITEHAYVEVYELLTASLEVHAILEIGVAKGFSLWLWRDWFPEAEIVGVDTDLSRVIFPIPDRTTLLEMSSAEYDTDEAFDLIVDDGSHLLEDQLDALSRYSEWLTPGGVLVIEDVDPRNLEHLTGSRFTGDRANMFAIDRRFVSGMRDDILVVYRNPYP